jgi:hypothetical protein
MCGKSLLLLLLLNAEPRQEICPTRDSAEIAHLNLVFHQAMELICDKVAGYVQEHCELDKENFM